MTTVLALETTSEICSVALNRQRNILAESQVAPRRHNELVLGLIDKLLTTAEIQRTEIDLIAFSSGPGSFTGVRLGASIAQGIAMGLGIKVIPVPTSDVMASRVSKFFPDQSEFLLKRQSHRGWVYVARYRLGSRSLTCLDSDQLVEESQVPKQAISNVDALFNAEDVIEVALNRTDQAVQPHLALPKLVAGDSPYVPSARKANASHT